MQYSIEDLSADDASAYKEYTSFETLPRAKQIVVWMRTAHDLARLKDREMQMRQSIVTAHFDSKKVGTQNIDLGRGWTLKAIVKETYRLDSDRDKLHQALDQLPEDRVERLINWRPAISVREYKRLDGADKDTINEVLTICPAAPALSLVPPKNT